MSFNLDLCSCHPVVSFSTDGTMKLSGEVTAAPSTMLDAIATRVEELGSGWHGYEEAKDAYDALNSHVAVQVAGKPPVALPYERVCEVMQDGSLKIGVKPKIDSSTIVDAVCSSCKAVAKDPSNISDQGMRLGFAGRYVEDETGRMFVEWSDGARICDPDVVGHSSRKREFFDRGEWEASRGAAKLRELLAKTP